MRIATFNNLDKIYQIIEKAKESLRNDGVDQWQKGSPDRGLLARQISRNRAYAYERDDQVIAYAYLSEDYEPTYASVRNMMKGENSITVHTFCLDSDFTKQGIASEFFNQIIDFARDENRDAIEIDTHEENFRMRRLIEKMGFSYLGIIYVNDNGTPMPRVAYELIL